MLLKLLKIKRNKKHTDFLLFFRVVGNFRSEKEATKPIVKKLEIFFPFVRSMLFYFYFTLNEAQKALQLSLTLVIGKPLTPRPVTWKSFPAGGGCFDLNSFAAVVTYRISKLGPPNATDVTCSAGILISSSMTPVVGLILKTFDAPNVATYNDPSESMVIPSGTKFGRFPLIVKSITTRPLAVNMQTYR